MGGEEGNPRILGSIARSIRGLSISNPRAVAAPILRFRVYRV